MLVLAHYTYLRPVKTNIFPFFPHMLRGKSENWGWVVAEKQPQVVMIPPHMV